MGMEHNKHGHKAYYAIGMIGFGHDEYGAVFPLRF